jgi:hypothetical protein
VGLQAEVDAMQIHIFFLYRIEPESSVVQAVVFTVRATGHRTSVSSWLQMGETRRSGKCLSYWRSSRHTQLKEIYHVNYLATNKVNYKTIFVALSPQANYTDWATAICRRNLVPTFVDRGISRSERVGTPTVVNLSFLDWSRNFSLK